MSGVAVAASHADDDEGEGEEKKVRTRQRVSLWALLRVPPRRVLRMTGCGLVPRPWAARGPTAAHERPRLKLACTLQRRVWALSTWP